jgi:hypothetical protein
MLSGPTMREPDFFGIFELNEAGTVLYSRLQNPEAKGERPRPAVGCNFFEELAGFASCDQLRSKFRNFFKSRQAFETFYLDCGPGTERDSARILMTKGHEYSSDPSQFVVLDIRKTARNGAF